MDECSTYCGSVCFFVTFFCMCDFFVVNLSGLFVFVTGYGAMKEFILCVAEIDTDIEHGRNYVTPHDAKIITWLKRRGQTNEQTHTHMQT